MWDGREGSGDETKLGKGKGLGIASWAEARGVRVDTFVTSLGHVSELIEDGREARVQIHKGPSRLKQQVKSD